MFAGYWLAPARQNYGSPKALIGDFYEQTYKLKWINPNYFKLAIYVTFVILYFCWQMIDIVNLDHEFFLFPRIRNHYFNLFLAKPSTNGF